MSSRINLTTGLSVSVLLFSLSGAAFAKDTSMMIAKSTKKVWTNHKSALEENKAKTKSFYDNVFNKHNVNAADALIAVNMVDHDPTATGQGLAGLKKDFSDFFKAFPDLKVTPDFMVAEGDLVTVYYTMTGTNTGEFMGRPATGKKIKVDGIDIVRIKNGKAVEHWGYSDGMGMMRQLAPSEEKK